jgi:hypothetical protein
MKRGNVGDWEQVLAPSLLRFFALSPLLLASSVSLSEVYHILAFLPTEHT